MTITVDALMSYSDGRRYDSYKGLDLPPGVRRWSGQAVGTGTVAGNDMDFRFDFDPQANVDWQPYVSLIDISIQTSVAALTINGVWGVLNASGWQENVANQNRTCASFPMRNYGLATTFAGHEHNPYYFGRMETGQQARMSIFMEEVDGTVYVVSASGLIADKPFMVPHYLR